MPAVMILPLDAFRTCLLSWDVTLSPHVLRSWL